MTLICIVRVNDYISFGIKDRTFIARPLNASSFDQNIFSDNLTVSVCIPAIPSDMKLSLPRLLESIQTQTHAPLEVIIVMSNVTTIDCKTFDEELKSILTSSKLLLYCLHKLQYQSLSRQNASALAQGTIISFIDADDVMYPNRIEVIVAMFLKYKPFMVLHAFSRDVIPPFNDKWKKARIFDGIELYDIAENTRSQHAWVMSQMMHSQVSVLRDVCRLVEYRTDKQFYRIEDSWFVRDVIKYFGRKNNTAIFIDTSLTRHVPREFQTRH